VTHSIAFFCGPGRYHFGDHFDYESGVFLTDIFDIPALPKWRILRESRSSFFEVNSMIVSLSRRNVLGYDTEKP